MSGNRIINTGGGTYNEIVHGDSINIQDNSVHIHGDLIQINQDLNQTATQIYQQMIHFQKQGNSPEAAQSKVVDSLKSQIKQKPALKSHLEKLGQYLGTGAANGVIGEAAVTGIRVALGLLGIPTF